MLDYIKYRIKLGEFYKQKTSIRESYSNEIRRAKMQGMSFEDIDSLWAEARIEVETIEESISTHVTDYLLLCANRRFVPIPSYDEMGMWEKCKLISSRYVLTNIGISRLRTALRSEMKERYEMVSIILAAITGIIGAATGLIAVLLK